MRCKLLLLSIIPLASASGALITETLKFTAVSKKDGYPEDGSDENNTFARFSPSADMSITVANEALHGKFTAGEEFYVDFTRANADPVPPRTKDLTFGEAIEALKAGKRVAREGWNGKGLFVFQQVPSEIAAEVVPRMQSLPDAVKDEFARRGGSIRYSDQLALVKLDNSISGWAPSTPDSLATDWMILA